MISNELEATDHIAQLGYRFQHARV